MKHAKKGHAHTGDIHKHVGHHLPPHPGRDGHAHSSHHAANKEAGMGRGLHGSGDNDCAGGGSGNGIGGGSGDNDRSYTGVKGGLGSPGGAGMASNVRYGK